MIYIALPHIKSRSNDLYSAGFSESEVPERPRGGDGADAEETVGCAEEEERGE